MAKHRLTTANVTSPDVRYFSRYGELFHANRLTGLRVGRDLDIGRLWGSPVESSYGEDTDESILPHSRSKQ